MTEDSTYEFNDGFQRKILALAIRGTLLKQSAGVFQSQFFGDPEETSTTPRQRIAQMVETVARETKGERPGAETIDQLVDEECKRLGDAEAQLLRNEWKRVRKVKVPDAKYVIKRATDWAVETALSAAIMQGARTIDESRAVGKPVDPKQLRELIDRANAIGLPGESQEGYLLRDANERMLIWQIPDYRRRVPTGLPTLDFRLDGGPTPGEVYYILAPPKSAKTCCLLNIALGASRARHGVAYFSYEMDFLNMLKRMDRNLARADKNELAENTFALERAIKGMRGAKAGEVVVRQFTPTAHGCEEAARVVEKVRGEGIEIDMVVMDYLNIMSSSGNEREKRHQLARAARDMTELGRELQVNVWSAALVGKQAVSKEVIKKDDIFESFEVVAVGDGFVAICGREEEVEQGYRRLFIASGREVEDETWAGVYEVNLDQMRFNDVTALFPDTQEEEDVDGVE